MCQFISWIVGAIKEGKFRGIEIPKELLTQEAWANYEKIRKAAWSDYKKNREIAWANYENKAWTDHLKTPWVDYEIPVTIWTDIVNTGWANYEKIRKAAFWDLLANTENRNPAWR